MAPRGNLQFGKGTDNFCHRTNAVSHFPVHNSSVIYRSICADRIRDDYCGSSASIVHQPFTAPTDNDGGEHLTALLGKESGTGRGGSSPTFSFGKSPAFLPKVHRGVHHYRLRCTQPIRFQGNHHHPVGSYHESPYKLQTWHQRQHKQATRIHHCCRPPSICLRRGTRTCRPSCRWGIRRKTWSLGSGDDTPPIAPGIGGHSGVSM